ncbi:MAPEG family protein [Ramlibacter sp. AN1015]|uniref:MAPEG family protein n=1 Tax=Ramlibacter sp. AN1015 TaxID=3133428 RepID=UPI0030C10CBC
MNGMHFTVAYGCILVAALLPYACAWLAKAHGFGKPRREGGYDNNEPRAWLAAQTGLSARANAAQANSFEALPFFIGAVIVAHQLGASQALIDTLAVLFVTLRIVYVALYVAGLAAARSLVWVLALAVNVGILLAGWR